MEYIDWCCGIGGMRAGLDRAGWASSLSIDNDADAVSVHQLAHGNGLRGDVSTLKIADIPDVDVWVAGFPCQPFSTSGLQNAFQHKAGNVFDHLARLMEAKQPRIVLLENVRGLLSNKAGHTFATVLLKLDKLGYFIDWSMVNLRWFGPPQTRDRLFLVASKPYEFKSSPLPTNGNVLPGLSGDHKNVFSRLMLEKQLNCRYRSEGVLAELEETLRPKIGKAKPAGQPFGPIGSVRKGKFISFNFTDMPTFPVSTSLAKIVAPNFTRAETIRSARYYARGSATKLSLRETPISHCVGTSLGGAPLYAVPLSTVKTKSQRKAFLEHSNWHREQEGFLVMRLQPSRSIQLFGPHTLGLEKAVSEWRTGETNKYKYVGNMVAPICSYSIARSLEKQLP